MNKAAAFLIAFSFLLVSGLITPPMANAQARCGDFERVLNCTCVGTEHNGFCVPSWVNSCFVQNADCVCGDATRSFVVNRSLCSSTAPNFCPYGQPMATNPGCTCDGTVTAGGICQAPQNARTNNVFGQVEPPPGVAQFNAQGGGGIGLIPFLSNLIRIATIVAGIIVFLNFILAGYKYLSSDGSAKVNEEVKNTLTYSVIGLLLIVASYTIIAIISLLLFGRADFILNPTISGPGAGTTP